MKKKQIMTLIGISLIFFSFIAIQGDLINNTDDATLNKHTGPSPVSPEEFDESNPIHKFVGSGPGTPDSITGSDDR